ncbi:MAG: DUF2203 domain-containing protein [Planctomycetota bacterium]
MSMICDPVSLFTVERANAALVYVEKVVRDIVGSYERVLEMRTALEETGSSDLSALESRYESAMDRLSELVDELHRAGVELRDFERGEVEFPAEVDGREVMLCWMLGESTVETWHAAEHAATARQPIELLG